MQNVIATPADLSCVVGPDALPPIAETTGLRDQQMEEGIAVRMRILVDVAAVQRFMELGTQLVHRREHVFVPAYPTDVVGPRSAIHAEIWILPFHLGDGFVRSARFPFFDARKNLCLVD